eukprot:TRINITY_DN1763_c0_g1_i1.p1 TRINITY_DN1763_c0_g1~~TRINITY_DN1763_c0_g1_i1.p1  ORF type:complete len:500 (+),score=111.31 TRINITY_DN1763_c0_g1_i1:40-1539(+)
MADAAEKSPSPNREDEINKAKDSEVSDFVDMLLKNPDKPFDTRSKKYWSNLRHTVVNCPTRINPNASPVRSEASIGSPGPLSPGSGAGSATPRLTSDGRVKLFVSIENEPMKKVLMISEEMEFDLVDKKIEEKFKRSSFVYYYEDGDKQVAVSNNETFRVFKEAFTGKLKLVAKPQAKTSVVSPTKSTPSPKGKAVFNRRHRFTGHTGPVYCCSISFDGSFAVTGARDYTAMMWDTESCRCRFLFKGHINHYVLCIDIAKNDKLIVSGDADGVLLVWEPTAGKIKHTIKVHSDRIYDARFSPDSSVIVSASLDKTARVFSVKDGSCLRKIEGHTQGVISVGFSQKPGSILLATGSDDTTIKLWNYQTGNIIDTLKNGHENTVWCVTFSSDDAIMVSCALSAEALVWDMGTRKVLRRLLGHSNTAVQRACFLAPRRFVTCGRDGMLVMWDLDRPANDDIVGRATAHDSIVYCTQANSRGTMVIASSADGTASCWDIAPGF